MPLGSAGQGLAAPSFSRDDVPLYKPSELASRLGLSSDGSAVTLILLTGGVAYELSWPIFPMREARPAHMPAAWTRGAKRRVAVQAAESLAGDSMASGDEAALLHGDASILDGLGESAWPGSQEACGPPTGPAELGAAD